MGNISGKKQLQKLAEWRDEHRIKFSVVLEDILRLDDVERKFCDPVSPCESSKTYALGALFHTIRHGYCYDWLRILYDDEIDDRSTLQPWVKLHVGLSKPEWVDRTYNSDQRECKVADPLIFRFDEGDYYSVKTIRLHHHVDTWDAFLPNWVIDEWNTYGSKRFRKDGPWKRLDLQVTYNNAMNVYDGDYNRSLEFSKSYPQKPTWAQKLSRKFSRKEKKRYHH